MDSNGKKTHMDNNNHNNNDDNSNNCGQYEG